MIPEKMQELLVLSTIIPDENEENLEDTFLYYNQKYDFKQIAARYKELMKEFLEPYALPNNSKE